MLAVQRCGSGRIAATAIAGDTYERIAASNDGGFAKEKNPFKFKWQLQGA